MSQRELLDQLEEAWGAVYKLRNLLLDLSTKAKAMPLVPPPDQYNDGIDWSVIASELNEASEDMEAIFSGTEVYDLMRWE